MNRWVHWGRPTGRYGGREGAVEFGSREDAVAWLRGQPAGTCVDEIPRHSTLSRERIIVQPDGTLKSEHGTVIG